MIAKITTFVKQHQGDLLLAACGLLIASLGYILGTHIASHNPESKGAENAAIINGSSDSHSTASTTPALTKTPVRTPIPTPVRDMRVVVSKTSKSMVYHYSWCYGAKQIKPVNQVWYASAAAAEAVGYTLSSNCKP